ncbi:hypothetical protein H072_1474 [Dactylellina haptotyla CBS 200.50]|uniref:Uncharacterized protein n=1 Tax=Dactylellina haptotyla (strain CBS 200.50) TaxID=1284197 RepID=S8ANW9_DACHA|nr:hypothetical protein H072_1474 [Dactylellina haptotyla CBS 200.50]
METINQATSSLKNTIWGEGNGETGRGAGTHYEVHKSMVDDTVRESSFSGRLESDPDAEGAYQPDQNDTARRPQGPTSTGGQPQGANVTGETEGTNKNPFSSSNEPNTGFGGGGAQPSVTADPSYAQQNTPKHQGGDRPNAEPDTASTGSGNSGVSGGPSGGSMGGGVGGMKLPDSENDSKGEGTGTLYEKSTGLAADGGDFDATRPGAAREAQRLMDEKGITHGDVEGTNEPPKEKKWYGVDHSGFGGHGSHSNKRPSVSKSSDDNVPHDEHVDHQENIEEHGEKKGLTQKIKEKLHHSSSD